MPLKDYEYRDYHADGQKDHKEGKYNPPSRRFRQSMTDKEAREEADRQYNDGQDNAHNQE
jgi:hypothetical protein